jgi:deoxyribodipyrimidine photolyase
MLCMTSIVLFRRDLRLSDNPALSHAAAKGPVIGLYVIDEVSRPMADCLVERHAGGYITAWNSSRNLLEI